MTNGRNFLFWRVFSLIYVTFPAEEILSKVFFLLKLEVLILIADCEKLLMFRQTEALSLATAD